MASFEAGNVPIQDRKSEINMKPDKETTKPSKKKITSRQAAAIAGIVLLVLLYVVTLAAAILDSSSSARWFWTCLFATIAVPLLVWIYSWMYGKLTGKSVEANPSNDEISSDPEQIP